MSAKQADFTQVRGLWEIYPVGPEIATNGHFGALRRLPGALLSHREGESQEEGD
jgi:hypothetical protein